MDAKKEAWPAHRATSRPSERTVASTAGETVQTSSSHSPPLRGGIPSMGSASTSSEVEARRNDDRRSALLTKTGDNASSGE